MLLLLGEEGARGEKEYFFVIHNLVVVLIDYFPLNYIVVDI